MDEHIAFDPIPDEDVTGDLPEPEDDGFESDDDAGADDDDEQWEG